MAAKRQRGSSPFSSQMAGESQGILCGAAGMGRSSVVRWELPTRVPRHPPGVGRGGGTKLQIETHDAVDRMVSIPRGRCGEARWDHLTSHQPRSAQR